MGTGTTPSSISKRERPRSRFRVMPAIAGCAFLLSACASQFGFGFAELPASQGWQPLPIGTWVLNDGVEARTMAFCPGETCPHRGFAALVAFEGSRGRRMEEALSASPAELARSFARLEAENAAERQRKARKPAKPAPDRSTTDIARFDAPEARGVLVTISSKASPARQAVTAILYGREGDRLVVALAVAENAEAARRDAAAAWRSR
ncbi:MAG TPA: hypothetical protein VIU82_11835 [Bosea sp. (in: a-proteobacteria)]